MYKTIGDLKKGDVIWKVDHDPSSGYSLKKDTVCKDLSDITPDLAAVCLENTGESYALFKNVSHCITKHANGESFMIFTSYEEAYAFIEKKIQAVIDYIDEAIHNLSKDLSENKARILSLYLNKTINVSEKREIESI